MSRLPTSSARIYANARVASGCAAEPVALAAELGERRAVATAGGRHRRHGGGCGIAPPVPGREVVDLDGQLLTPGFIDCHTHIVYGGNRTAEFERRRAGESYASIARSGGGIASTMRATRALSEEALIAQALPRVDALLADGVTTLEIKSGYGLTLDSELKLLRTARRIGTQRAVSVVTSFLGAHALPPEAGGDADRYIDRLCEEWLPAVADARLADAVDAFCEGIGFSPAIRN